MSGDAPLGRDFVRDITALLRPEVGPAGVYEPVLDAAKRVIAERDLARQAHECMVRRFNQVTADVLVALADKVATPEKGYAVDSWAVRGDIERAVDAARAEGEAAAKAAVHEKAVKLEALAASLVVRIDQYATALQKIITTLHDARQIGPAVATLGPPIDEALELLRALAREVTAT